MATAPATRVRDYLDIEHPWDMRAYRRIRDEICTLRHRDDPGGVFMPTVTEWAVDLDCSEGGETRNIFKRLEDRGLIRVWFYQRTRQVQCVETGLWSAGPKNRALHWRHRSLTVEHLRGLDPELAIDIQDMADARGVLVCDIMAECVIAAMKAGLIQSRPLAA